MDCWRGVVVHSIYILLQPLYLTARYLLNPEYFSQTSPVWLIITATTWIYIVTQVAIPFLTSPLRHFPSPPGERFPIGHIGFDTGIEELDAIVNETPNDGYIVCWGFFYLVCQIIPVRPDILMEVMNTRNYDWEKPGMNKKLLARATGIGLIVVEGDEHKAMRKIVAPAFSGRRIRDLVPLFYDKGLALADTMARRAQDTTDGALEMMDYMSRATLDIIGAAGVGKDFNTIENNEDRLANLYATMTQQDVGNLFLVFFGNLLVPTWVIKLFKGTIYAKMAHAHTDLRIGVGEMMHDKKRMLQEKPEAQQDIIATIMKSGSFSDRYLTDQLLTFLGAGHDTTSSALTWTLWLLSINPSMQDRLRQECMTQLGDKTALNIDASVFDAETTPYLTAVVNETLRLYPTVPVTDRVATKATQIGGQHVPKGTMVLLAPWGVNRRRELWGPDANEFNPDRWLKGDNAANGGAESPYAQITFLYGPRSCIGQSFARTEMKCILAALIMRFRFAMANPNERVEPIAFVTIKPRNGMRLKLYDLQPGASMKVGVET